ncbi:probable palmitoyltransferase ZDHHC24 [Macrosteles quadrilineatus]|uniref:probable palmitoyltransferase ZDHHC24 n=1 Tax=Macrosteles quadrilineatus TaxID=74068 RepID=UPI0023E2E8D6|nr:probable palmitoyltransferase ZDHHC24 [Macrosteles quadrilineatus]
MKLRNKFFPITCLDIVSFVFISLIVPFGYCFEILLVLPTFYSATSFWFILHAFSGSFVLVNIVSNFVFIMITDTSVKKNLESQTHGSQHWNFCRKCDIRIPPRSWHCNVCNCCVLKRDHHCQFTGCCIGHHNHRYFFFFVFYMALGTIYALYLHTRYIYRTATEYVETGLQFRGSRILAFALGLSYSIQNCYLLFYGVTLFGVGVSMFFFLFHFTTMTRGQVLYERARDINAYDSGSVKKNIEQVLGKRWYLAWISPFVTSELPSDGVKWAQHKFNKRVI